MDLSNGFLHPTDKADLVIKELPCFAQIKFINFWTHSFQPAEELDDKFYAMLKKNSTK